MAPSNHSSSGVSRTKRHSFLRGKRWGFIAVVRGPVAIFRVLKWCPETAPGETFEMRTWQKPPFGPKKRIWDPKRWDSIAPGAPDTHFYEENAGFL